MATHDLCFVVDGTGSMTHFVASLAQSLPQVMQLTRIVDAIDRVGVLVYRDYDRHCPPPVRGRCHPGWSKGSLESLKGSTSPATGRASTHVSKHLRMLKV